MYIKVGILCYQKCLPLLKIIVKENKWCCNSPPPIPKNYNQKLLYTQPLLYISQFWFPEYKLILCDYLYNNVLSIFFIH